MKLASLKHGRDGQLVVVSRDLKRAADASHVVPTLQAALDDWGAAAPRLQEVADALEAGRIAHLAFDPKKCAAPLPRAFQWADGSAYVNHVELVRKARGAEMPASFWTDPLMYQGGSDAFLGPGAIRLVVLVNDVSLRNLIAAELAKGFGFFHAKPSSAFSPVAVTPDELGHAFDGAKLALPLLSHVNGAPFGKPNAGVDMTFDFPTLVAHAAKTRPLSAGTIVGSGTVSNKDAGGNPGRPIAEGGLGYSCIAEQRMVETIRFGKPKTPFLKFGDRVRIEMLDSAGRSIFGAIDQTVVPYRPRRPA